MNQLKLNIFLSTIVSLFLFSSCSSDSDDDLEALKPKIVNFIIDNENAFIEQKMTVTIDGNNFEKTSLISNKPNDVIITKISEQSYEITSTKAIAFTITLTLFNEDKITTERKTIQFYEHGTKDLITIEGLVVDNSSITSSKEVLLIHGEPEAKFQISDIPVREIWYYFSKGFEISIQKFNNNNNSFVEHIFLHGRPWSRSIDNVLFSGLIYPHNIGEFGNFKNPNGILMDDVVAINNLPIEENKLEFENNPTFKVYRYGNTSSFIDVDIDFAFFAEDINDYKGKRVNRIVIF